MRSVDLGPTRCSRSPRTARGVHKSEFTSPLRPSELILECTKCRPARGWGTQQDGLILRSAGEGESVPAREGEGAGGEGALLINVSCCGHACLIAGAAGAAHAQAASQTILMTLRCIPARSTRAHSLRGRASGRVLTRMMRDGAVHGECAIC